MPEALAAGSLHPGPSAAARLSTSLVRRSSQFSCSSTLTRAASAVLTPS